MMPWRRRLLLVGLLSLVAPILEAAEGQYPVSAQPRVLTTPRNLSPVAVSSSEIDLCWSATDDRAVTGYTIYRNGVQVATSTFSCYTDTGLTAATSYFYTVASHDAHWNTSAQSEPATDTTFPLRTDKLQIGARAEVINGASEVRATPSTSGTLLCSGPERSGGTVLGGPTQADGYTWWNIEYEYECVVQGWSVEEHLIDFREKWAKVFAESNKKGAEAEVKLWARLKTKPVWSPGITFVPGRVSVKFVDGVTEEEKNALIAQYNAKVEKSLEKFNIMYLRVPEGSEIAVAEALRQHPEVRWAELDRYVYPANSSAP